MIVQSIAQNAKVRDSKTFKDKASPKKPNLSDDDKSDGETPDKEIILPAIEQEAP